MDGHTSMLHLSTLSIWDIDKNKGRVSTYLPLKGFTDKGYNVNYITSDTEGESRNIEGIYVKKIKLPLRPLKIRYLSKITGVLFLPFISIVFFIHGVIHSLSEKPDIIYAHTTRVAIPAFLLSKLFSSKYILRLYGISANENMSIFEKLVRLDLYIAFRLKASLYILTNDGTSADKFAISQGVPEEKIHFLKNGIKKDVIHKSFDRGLKKTLAPNGEKIILSVSRLVNWKQVDLIIKAIPDIIKQYENVKLVIVGDGKERENLESLVHKNNIDAYVKFVGSVEQERVFHYMNAADLFVSMNALSSMSNPVYEAMITETPVVALNTGSTEDLIIDNVTGILIQPNQIEKMPQIISDLLKNDKKRNKIAKNAQRYIMKNWPTWEERVNYEVKLIEDLLD